MKPADRRRQARGELAKLRPVRSAALPASLARLQLGPTWSETDYARAALEELPLGVSGRKN